MERLEWIKYITNFQAQCRGYLIRKELKLVQTEYEAIVRELEGSLDHLSWKGHLLPKPHFTHPDDDVFTKYCRSKIQMQDCPADSHESKNQSETTPLQSEDLIPERDDPIRSTEEGCSESEAPKGGEAEQESNNEAAGKSCMNLGTNDFSSQHKGVQMSSLLPDVKQTPEALLQHRNTLAMELLWIQQAIASRKKYLSLKQKMEAA